MITFHVEPWGKVVGEMRQYWPTHWEEVGQDKAMLRLAPHEEMFARLAQSGALHVVVARAKGKLIGYHVSIVEQLLHYSHTLASKADMYWLHPEFRGPRVAVRFFSAVEASLLRRGVKRAYLGCKLGENDHDRFLQHLGYIPFERHYYKILEN